MSPSTHQDSPKVPEVNWPILRVGEDHHGVLFTLAERNSAAPRRQTETYIPLSALLSDEVVEAVQVALERAAEEASGRGMRGLGISAAEAKALVSLLVDAETALQAVIEQVGGAE